MPLKRLVLNMNASNQQVILENESALLSVHPAGGAITSFHLKSSDINPLAFSFSKEQMPLNNQAGACYQGHFACIGRWGEPSPGEMAAGIPNHGEPANGNWDIEQISSTELHMHCFASKEGLEVSRKIIMDPIQPVCFVEETVTNVDRLGRMINVVQHPTLAAPFLEEKVVINCNGHRGFDQRFYQQAEEDGLAWPAGKDSEGNLCNLETAGGGANALHSFIVQPAEEIGWITAFSPTNNLLIGYAWPRKDYPWINIWRHFEAGHIKYTGIEFGTTGIHQPFDQIVATAPALLGEKTFSFLDAGAAMVTRYMAFIHATEKDFKGVDKLAFLQDALLIHPRSGNEEIIIQLKKAQSWTIIKKQ